MDGGECSNPLCIAESYQIVFIYFKMVTMVNFMVSFSITIHVSFLCVAVNKYSGKNLQAEGFVLVPGFRGFSPLPPGTTCWAECHGGGIVW